jgi:hypothetical protein
MKPGLTPEQLNFFNSFGYVIFRNFFTPDEMKIIQREVSAEQAEQYAHTPFDGSRRHWTVMMGEKTPFFANMLEDPRFLVAARQMFGNDVLGIMTDSNRYVGDTPWHPDSRKDDFNGVKFAIYLEPVGAKTGALRVFPTSHLRTHEANQKIDAGIHGRPIDEAPATVLDSQPGDVVAFDLRLWHASCGGKTDRRMCTVIYYANPKTPAGADYLVHLVKSNIDMSHNMFKPQRKHIYPRHWLDNPSRNPDRQKWIDRQREIGCFDPEHAVEPAVSLVR